MPRRFFIGREKRSRMTKMATAEEPRKRTPPLPLAERQKLSPPQMARLWGIDSQKVLDWIKQGLLKAINVSSGSERPRYLIDRADIQAFENARAVRLPAPARKPRQRAVAVKEYF